MCLTFEQGQRGELHLGALVPELGRAVGPPLPGSAHRPPREAVHLLRGRNREAGGRRGRAGRRQLGRLHDGCGWQGGECEDAGVNGGEEGGMEERREGWRSGWVAFLNHRWIIN